MHCDATGKEKEIDLVNLQPDSEQTRRRDGRVPTHFLSMKW